MPVLMGKLDTSVNGPEGLPLFDGDAWELVDWRRHEEQVRRLRGRIFKAVQEGDWPAARSLQKLMLRSWSNVLVSVRQATQRNTGRRTAGIDGLVALTSQARAEMAVHVHASIGSHQPSPVRRVDVPKASDKTKMRPLGIPVLSDRCHQARVRNALEPEWEARFEPRSYGFQPGRGCHDAIESLFCTLCGKGKRAWVLDADLAAAFDKISHDRLLQMIGGFPAREMIAGWLKAGVFEAGKGFAPTGEGTPQGGVITPPTQWITRAMVTLRIVAGWSWAGGGAFADGDAVPDGDLLWADEDVFDQEPQDALAFFDGRGGGPGVQLGEEAFEVAGELEVGVAVGELGFQGADLGAEVCLAGAQVRHARAELVDGEQLLLERFDHGGDRGGGLGERGFQLLALPGDRVGRAGGLQPLGDLGADQGGVGEHARDVVPDDGVEVVGADWLVAADPAAFVAVVIRSQAPVVVDLLVRGAGRGAVVAVPARRARRQPLQQRGDPGVAGGESLVVFQPLLHALEGLLGPDGRDGDLLPFLAGPVHGPGRPGHGAALQAGDPVQPRGLLQDDGLAGIPGPRSEEA